MNPVASLLSSVWHDRMNKHNSHILTTYVVAMHHCMEHRHGSMQGGCGVVQVHGLDLAPLPAPLLVP